MPNVEKIENLVIGSGGSGKFVGWTMAAAGHRTAMVERGALGGACPGVPSITAGLELTNALFQGEKLSGSQIFYGAGNNTKLDSFALTERKKMGIKLAVKSTPGHGENVVGILSERDIVEAMARHGGELLAVSVSEVMTCPVVTCEPGDSVAELMAEMTNRRIRHFPVVDDGRLVGIVSIGDLVKSRLDEIEYEAHSMRSFIAGAA